MAAAQTFRRCHVIHACLCVFGLFLSAQASTSSLGSKRAIRTCSRSLVCEVRSLRMVRHRTSGHVSLPRNAKGPHQLCGLRASTPDMKKPAPLKLVSGSSRIDPTSWNLWHEYVDYTRFPFRQHKPCKTTTTTHCWEAHTIHVCH